MTQANGSFVWYELMSSDTEGASAFYCDVVGWQARDASVQGVAYTLLSVDGADVAGLMALPPQAEAAGARPGWNGYVAVDDVDAQAARIAAAGGTVHRPPDDIPGVGRFAMVADPGGAVFALFKGAMACGEWQRPALNAPGRVGWHELYAADGAAAFAFYAGQFGWSKDQAMDMGEMGIYQLFSVGGEAVGAMLTKPATVPAPFWNFYFNVEAIDAAAGRIKAGGGQVVMGPMEVPGGQWIVQCRDPQGGFFSLLAPGR
jgi:uncharacterized protein